MCSIINSILEIHGEKETPDSFEGEDLKSYIMEVVMIEIVVEFNNLISEQDSNELGDGLIYFYLYDEDNRIVDETTVSLK